MDDPRTQWGTRQQHLIAVADILIISFAELY